MADLVPVTSQVAPVFAMQADIWSLIAGVALEYGDAVYMDANGVAVKSDASAAGTAKFWGIVTQAAGAGQAVEVTRRGQIAGMGVGGLSPLDPVYLSDTAGKVADATGTVTVVVGIVVTLPDNALTQVLYVDAQLVA